MKEEFLSLISIIELIMMVAKVKKL
jgi:hypothetical protein